MKTALIIGESFSYAKGVFRDFRRFLVLVVLSLIPVLNFIVLGYWGRILWGARSEKELPPLENLGTLWFIGLKMFIVAIIYSIGVWIINLLGVGFGVGLFMGRILSALHPSILIYITFMVVVAFGSILIMEMALACFVKSGDFRRAFSLREILQIIHITGWKKYMIVVVINSLLQFLVAAPLVFLTVMRGLQTPTLLPVGYIVMAVFTPFLMVFNARSIGHIYCDGVGEDMAPPPVELEPETTQIPACPTCGRGLSYIESYDRYYCHICRRYAPRESQEKKVETKAEGTEGPSSTPDEEEKNLENWYENLTNRPST